jgi:hypothetical protein
VAEVVGRLPRVEVVGGLVLWVGSPSGVDLLGWEDAGVKGSGSLWFGYAVVLVSTFVVGFLAFAVWVLSKVF